MLRLALTAILIFVVPLAIACFFQHLKDSWKERERLQREWRARLRAKELELGRRLSLEEIQAWLEAEWFRERIQNLRDFVREIRFNLLKRQY
jgi:hypothetical protein